MNAAILCGGMGSRLRSVVSDRPKPMVEIDGTPFLDLLIGYLSSFGFKRFVLCTGYKSQMIREHYSKRNTQLEIVVSEENVPLGTAGSLKNAEKHIQSDPFLVVNGDSFCDVDIRSFCDAHFTHNAMMSMVVVKTETPDDYGSVALDDSGRIISFKEKQKQTLGFINGGIYLFDKSIFSFIPPNVKCSFEHDVFPQLIQQQCYGFPCQKKLIDIGTPRRLIAAREYFQQHRIVSMQSKKLRFIRNA